MSRPSPEQRFQRNIVDLTDFIKDIIVRCHEKKQTTINPSVVEVIGEFLDSSSASDIINTFATRSHPYWQDIQEHDEKFFKDSGRCRKVFEDLPVDYIDAFRKLFETYDADGNSVINNEEKSIIWAYFESFVKISLHYIHEQRKPKITKPKNKRIYTCNFLPEVKLQKSVKNWKVTLEWPTI